MNTNVQELEIDFVRAIKALWKKAWLIAITSIMCAALAFGSARYLIAPKYESSILLYVNNSSFSLGNTSFSFSSSELTAAKTLVDTYIVILNTRSTLEAVLDKAELDYSYEDFQKMITANAVNDTEVFEVVVTSESPQEAAKIANIISEVLPNKVAAVVDGSSMRIVDYAVVPEKKASPNISLFTILGFLIGAVASCGVVIVLELLDDEIHDESFLNQNFDIPIIANIPNLNSNGVSYGKYGGYYGNSK